MMKTKNQLSEVLRAMNFPKQGDILSETQVLASTANMEDGILKYEVDFPKGTKTKDIPTLLKKFFSTQIVPTEDNLVVRYHDYTVKPKAGNVTVVGAMHIIPVVRANPSVQEFDQDYSKMEMENPHTYFRHHDCGEQNSPQFRAKMFTLVSHMGENYGYGLGKGLYHRRASLIMPKIKITKAVPEATMMYHTHPRRDEPSLSSPDDYLLYMDLSHKPRSIRHFYTVMADRLDHFQIKPKKDSKGNYVKLDEDKILKELNDEMDDIEAMWEKKTPKTGDYQDDLRFCENITRDFVKWLNKRYSQYFTFTYKCHYKVKKNPPEPEIDDLHLNDEILGKSLDAIKNRDYSWDAPVKEKAHETYAYWHQIRREDTLQGSASTLGITPQGSHKRTYERYMKKIFEESQYTYFDALNILNLAHDISMIDSKIRDGGGLSSRMAEICDYLEMPEEATETLLFLEEVIHNEDIFTAEAETMTGDFYGLALLASYTIQAIGAIDLVKKGEKNFESVQYNIYSRLKTETQEKFQTFLVGELDHRGKAYGENAPIAQGFVDSFLNPPQVSLKRTELGHVFPKEAFAYDYELVKEALDEFNVEKYEPTKTFVTGKNALNLRFPVTTGKVSMTIQPRTGTAQIFVTGRPNAMEDALDAVTKVGTALVRYGLPGIDPETYDVQAIDIAQNPQTSQVIAIAGPSGAGKSTTIRGLLKLLPNSKTIPTLTTRQKRKSDKPGERIFVSVEQFKKEMNDGELVAAEMQKNGNYYGRRKSDFENAGYVIIDVNPRGVNAIKRAYPNTFTAYLEPVEDPEFIRKRLLRRGDMSPQEAKARAAIIPSHIKSSKQIDFDARVKTKQGEFAKIALELEPLIPKQNPNLGEMVRKIFRRKREADDPEVLPETPPPTWEEIEASLPADDMDQEEVNKMYAKFGIGPTPVEASGDQSVKGNPSKKPKAVRIEESPNKEKKLVAYFYDKDGKKFRTVHFGARGMSDFTQHKDPKRKKNYLARHGGMGENWKDPMTAGALSRWILWGKPSLRESFNDFKKKFKIEGVMAVTNTRMNPHHCPIEVEARRAASDKGFKHHKWYIEHHLDYVMAIAKAIVNSDEPEDQQLIHDMVWMHDYPKMLGDNDNFELVRELVSKHRDERYTDRLMNQLRWMEEIKSPDWGGRTTTIAAVMSTADALAHYYGPFWQIYLDENPDTPIAELKKSNAKKLEKDKNKLRAGPMKDALDSVKFQYKGRKVRVVGNEHIAELIARKNPKAPGYNSYGWTTQDWRSIKVNNKGDIDYSEKCGAEDTQVADGTPRLCLPAEVVRTLMKSKNGKEILLTQARKKARAAKGTRVPWHPRIKKIWKRVEDKTVKDNAPNFISARDPQKWSDRYDKIIKMSGDELLELAEKQAAEKGLTIELTVENREYKENSRQVKLPPKQQKMYKEYIESMERATITLSRGSKLIDRLRFTILTQSPKELVDYLTNRKVWRKESIGKRLEGLGSIRRGNTTHFEVYEIPMVASLQNKKRFPFAVAGGGGYRMSEGQKGKGYYGIIKTYQAGFLEANDMEQYGMGESPMRSDLYQSYGWLTAFSYKDNYPYPSKAAEYYLNLHGKSKEANKEAHYQNVYRPVYSRKMTGAAYRAGVKKMLDAATNPPEWRHGEFAEEDPFEEYF
jgi:guanylate kinase